MSDLSSDFIDEDTNPERRAPLHPEVVHHAVEYAKACRHYQRPLEVIATADRLVAMAKGSTGTERVTDGEKP